MRVTIVLVLIAAAVAVFKNSDPVFNNDMINYINSAQSGWTASSNQGNFFGSTMTMKDAKRLMGTKIIKDDRVKTVSYKHLNINLPDTFNSADNWPSCSTIMHIRDQSACGSCWALAAAEAMSDRYCTMLKGNQYESVMVSAGDLMACCDSCGDGCDGGFPSAAWDYWVQTGLADTSCDPYPFPPCEHHVPANHYPVCPSNEYPTPQCNNTACDNGSSAKFYYGKTSYTVSGEEDIMKEIYQNGPIEVAFTVYSDFLSYKSGVYKHVTGDALGGHAVKMIGWGVMNGQKYWVINNSWNTDWGNKGQFYIARGNDECGIEDSGSAGAPKPF
jgi:C1A family cysteine protease